MNGKILKVSISDPNHASKKTTEGCVEIVLRPRPACFRNLIQSQIEWKRSGSNRGRETQSVGQIASCTRRRPGRTPTASVREDCSGEKIGDVCQHASSFGGT